SVSRLASGSPLRRGSKPYELALLLLRVYRSLDAIMGGDRGLAREWLESENRALGGRPIDRILTITGLTEVAAHVDAFRARV
ncbi:MAG TPA: MbcA/ParS/Xre antitoxin family protein, partial [Thalassobaculum sp.]